VTYITAILLSLGVIGAYAILAIGIVMIYRASKVLNLAHGAMAMVPPYVVYALSQGRMDSAWAAIFAVLSGLAVGRAASSLLSRRLGARSRRPLGIAAGSASGALLFAMFRSHAPLFIALPLGIVAGGALGWSVERWFIRPLRREGPTAQTVGTVAALGILIAVTAKIFGTTPLPSVHVFPQGQVEVGLSSIRYGEFGLFGVMAVITGLLILLFQRTDLGLMMRGTAENRRAASLMGVDPDRITGLAWIMGGALAGLSGILLASITNLHPYVLSLQALPAFVAALIGGLASVQGGVVGAVVVGASIGLVPTLPVIKNWQGGRELFLALLAIAVMAMRGRRIEAGDVRGDAGGSLAAPRALPAKPARAPEETARRRRIAILAGLAVFVAFPWVPSKAWFSVLGSANDAARFTLIATSLVLLVGWVGQISLGHAALVGVGGYLTGAAAAGLGVPFPLNLPVAIVGSAAIAAALGIVAVRVRGLYLAVATLIFSWMADSFLFRQGWLLKYGQIKERPIGGGVFPFFDFTDRRIFYFVAWSVAIAGIIAASNLRDSKTGRAFFAVRGSEMAAASLGIDVVRTKLVAFALSGALAGAAGNLFMSDQRVLNADSFTFNRSFFFLSIAVVGGLQSLGGGVAAAVLFASLSVLFFRVQALSGLLDIVSAGLLAVVLLTYREGLAAVPRSLAVARAWLAPAGRAGLRLARPLAPAGRTLAGGTDALARAISRPLRRPALMIRRFRPAAAGVNGDGDAPSGNGERAGLSGDAPARPDLPERRDERRTLIEVHELTVRFGGLTAVGDVSLKVCEGEIVGLIGPNGAGKTVTFNAISGLVAPTQGRIALHGRDVTDLPVHVRAQMGLARTFQVIQLFGQLSVFDNLLVATHVHNQTGLAAHVLATEGSIAAELENRERVRRVIDRLGLQDFADRRAADLPFGVLRMVEIARALVTGHPLIMLDEAASGLDNAETDRLSDLLRFVRDLGVTLLLIEHDVKFVTSLSDYMYVLDRGSLIAEGRPEEIKRNPAVVAAYLGDAHALPEEAEVR
jgi:sulfate-transporting ATPase